MRRRLPLLGLLLVSGLAACGGGADDGGFALPTGSTSAGPSVGAPGLPPLPSLTAAPGLPSATSSRSASPTGAASTTTSTARAATPTTARPTTARPTTAQPTTARPTSARPTTARPTTARPTTAQPTTAAPAPTTARVSMGENFFSPRSVTVARGGTVTTSNDGRIDHDWVGPFWDSDNMAPGDTFTVTFPSAGTFDYVCTYHGGMAGSVTVR